jgi:alkaline phosphatase D
MLVRQLEARNHPQLLRTVQSVPILTTWDDHDFGFNNCDGWGHRNDAAWVRRDLAAGVYRAMWNHPYQNGANHIHYDVPWGPIHFFMTDGRYFSDRLNQRGILGDDQIDWLVAGLAASDAAVKVVVLGSQLIRTVSGASFEQCAPAERARLLDAFDKVKGRVLVVSGDVHFSEVQSLSVAPRFLEVTSSPLRVDDAKREHTKPADPHRLWHTVRDNFVVVDVDLTAKAPSGKQGLVTIEARSDSGEVLPSAGPVGRCRTLWDITTGELTPG